MKVQTQLLNHWKYEAIQSFLLPENAAEVYKLLLYKAAIFDIYFHLS